MGFSDYIPPFAGASPEQAHTGINYASGAAGILEETSYHMVRTYLLSREVNYSIWYWFRTLNYYALWYFCIIGR